MAQISSTCGITTQRDHVEHVIASGSAPDSGCELLVGVDLTITDGYRVAVLLLD